MKKIIKWGMIAGVTAFAVKFTVEFRRSVREYERLHAR